MIDALDDFGKTSYLEIIGHVIVLSSRASKHVVVIARCGLIRRRRLGIVGIFERVALGRLVVARICRHFSKVGRARCTSEEKIRYPPVVVVIML